MNPQLSPERIGFEKSVRQALTEAKIDSLDTLVSHLVDLSTRQLRDEDHLLMIGGGSSESTKPHQPPEMNLVIDGEQHAPSVITQFNGRALYSTPGVDSNGDPVLYSFTTLSSFNDHLTTARHQFLKVRFELVETSNPDTLSDLSYYYEHDSGEGDWLQNGPGRAWRDLTRVRRGFGGFGDWNDIISSVNWCRWDISLYEHVGYGGSILYLPAGRTYPNLRRFGWNDRASSTVNWGRRF